MILGTATSVAVGLTGPVWVSGPTTLCFFGVAPSTGLYRECKRKCAPKYWTSSLAEPVSESSVVREASWLWMCKLVSPSTLQRQSTATPAFVQGRSQLYVMRVEAHTASAGFPLTGKSGMRVITWASSCRVGITSSAEIPGCLSWRMARIGSGRDKVVAEAGGNDYPKLHEETRHLLADIRDD